MAGRGESDCGTIESYCRFLVWFIAEGRKRYRYPLVIPQAIREAVTSPILEGRHLLMDLLLSSTVGTISDRYEALARYYFQVVPKFGLGPFIGGAEVNAFKSSSSLTRLAGVASAVEQGAPDSPVDLRIY
jgi:hypothetical protein